MPMPMSCGVQDAEGGLAQRLGDGELVHLLVVALLQVDDLALGRAGDQDHREAVRGGVGERRQAIQKAGRRHGQAHAGLLGQEAGDGGGIAGVLLVAERQNADALGLRHAAEIGDRNAGHAVDRVEAVELQRIDDEVKPVRQLRLVAGRVHGLRLCGHSALSQVFLHCFGRRRAIEPRSRLLAATFDRAIRWRMLKHPINRAEQTARHGRASASVCSRTRRSARSLLRASSASTISL